MSKLISNQDKLVPILTSNLFFDAQSNRWGRTVLINYQKDKLIKISRARGDALTLYYFSTNSTRGRKSTEQFRGPNDMPPTQLSMELGTAENQCREAAHGATCPVNLFY